MENLIIAYLLMIAGITLAFIGAESGFVMGSLIMSKLYTMSAE